MSLFAERKIIEIRMTNPAPGEQGADVDRRTRAQSGSPDNLVLIITGKMDGRTQNARWVSAIEKHGVVVQIWPIDVAAPACAGSASDWAVTVCRPTRPPPRCWRNASKAICSPRTRKSKSSPCCCRRVR